MDCSSFNKFCDDLLLELDEASNFGNKSIFSLNQLKQAFCDKWNQVLGGQDNEDFTKELVHIQEELNKQDQLTDQLENNHKLLQLQLKEKEDKCASMQENLSKRLNMFNNLMSRKKRATNNLSKMDVNYMQLIQREEKAYRFMTGINWDLPLCTKTNLQGYIRHPTVSKLKLFEADISSLSSSEVADKIWKKIESVVEFTI